MNNTLKLEIANRGPVSVTHDPRGQMHIAHLGRTRCWQRGYAM